MKVAIFPIIAFQRAASYLKIGYRGQSRLQAASPLPATTKLESPHGSFAPPVPVTPCTGER